MADYNKPKNAGAFGDIFGESIEDKKERFKAMYGSLEKKQPSSSAPQVKKTGADRRTPVETIRKAYESEKTEAIYDLSPTSEIYTEESIQQIYGDKSISNIEEDISDKAEAIRELKMHIVYGDLLNSPKWKS